MGGCKNSRLLGWSEKNRLLNGVQNGPADNIICYFGHFNPFLID